MDEADKPRQLSRQETHDLSMIIKDRSKVLKAHVAAQEAALLADFEAKLAAEFTFDADDVWKAATKEAMTAVAAAQEIIDARCAELGIPKSFAPSINASWQGRGENATAQRRAELRRVAKSAIEAMGAAATVRIERQSLDLRTQVVAMGLLSPEAKLFLETLAPIEESMTGLDFQQIEAKLESQRSDRRRLSYGLD